VLDQRMPHDEESGKIWGGGHGVESSIFAV
jgi:hypothetical protein